MTSDYRTWKELLWSRNPEFLREAADLAERLGRDQWAEAFRESADCCEDLPGSSGCYINFVADDAPPKPNQEAA